MNLKIEGIRYQNIREFRDLELDFTDSNGNPHHISLVQMPNGTGKTTTMQLIRTVLLGRDLTENEIDSFAPNEFDASTGKFEIDLRTPDEFFTLRLKLNYDVNDFSYRHIKPQEAGGGDAAGHYLPTQLDNIIRESFVDLFVFNGELTEDFLSRGRNEAENALKIVNFLNRMEYQREQIEQVVEEQEKDQNVTTEQGYNNIKRRVENSKKQLRKLRSEKSQLEDDISGLEDRVETIEAKRERLLSENEEKLEEYERLRDEIDDIRTTLETEVDALLDDMRRPSRLSENINDDLEKLLENMNIMKLPKSTSQEFFTELAESDECICGRPIGDDEEEKILKGADDYLSEQDIGVLNSLKDKLRSIPDAGGFDNRFSRVEDHRDELRQKRQELAAVDLEDEDLNERLEDLAEEKNEKENEIEEKEELLKMLTTADSAVQEQYELDWETNIELCKSRRNKFQNQLREASDTVTFGKKADLLEDMLQDFIKKCLESLKEKQIKDTNKKLDQILGLSRIQVEDIDDSIIIKGREGASEGQSLSVAYAYLSSLFEDSRVDVPFVIDSPAVSIDYDKREQVAHMISNLFDQLVIFVISPERERFVDQLESDDIRYLTVHKTETPGDVEKHLTKDYFMDFQSEEEMEV